MDLINEYKTSSFYDIYRFILHSDYMEYVVDVNFNSLFNCIINYEEEAFFKNNHPQKEDLPLEKTTKHLKEFIRNFHNYATSVNALEKHYENLFRRPCKSGLSTNNAEKLFNEIKRDPLHLFIIGLRHYLIHEGVPSFNIALHKSKEKDEDGTLYLTQGEFKFKRSIILIDHREAKPLKGRKGKAKSDSAFLRDNKKREILYNYTCEEWRGSYIDLKDVILDHYAIFSQHLKSVEKELININQEEYKKTKDLHNKIKKLQNKI